MTKRIILNAFDMGCVTHQAPGLWRHPDNRADEYNTLEYWTNLAQLLERGRFDAIFLADVVGIYDVYQDSAAPPLTDAAQVPLINPLLQIPAMAAVTEHLGFGVTVALTYEQPYSLARTFSTLDHFTKGRIGWNIVTSYLNSAAINLGLDQQLNHDDRYALGEEFLDVTYKLWEGSWDEGAVLRDRESGVFTDPTKVHPIEHEGTHFRVPGIHLAEPSPQRTPVLFQAGTSRSGKAFAAKHSEATFITGISPELTAKTVRDLRDLAEAEGRARDDLKVLTLVTIITAETDELAQEKYEDYRRYVSYDGALTLFGGWSGVDLSGLDPNEPLKYVETNAVQSALAMFTTVDPDRIWTPIDVAEYVGIGGMGPVIVGSPQTVADELERWVEVADVDGFNIAYAITPGSFEDVVDHVIPELRDRGRVWAEYPEGTLRERLTGAGPHLPDSHPAAQYRGAFTTRSAADGHASSVRITA